VIEDKALPIPIPLAPKPILLNAPGLAAISLNLGCAIKKALKNMSDMKKYFFKLLHINYFSEQWLFIININTIEINTIGQIVSVIITTIPEIWWAF
jgi:hypothetical protein